MCDVIGELVDSGAGVPRGCPDCTWSFDLLGDHSPAVGHECDDLEAFGAPATYDGAWDGTEYAWAWTDSFDFYGDGSVYTDNTILVYSATSGAWGAFAWNYAGYDSVKGTSAKFEAVSTRPYYYYYYV